MWCCSSSTGPHEDALKTIGVYAVTTVFLALPILTVSKARLNVLGKFTKADQVGNLNHPLSWWQMLGIWPSGDFRGHPSHPTLTHILALLVAAGAIFAVVMAWRRGRLEVVVALATGVIACLVYVERASPWVAGKALAVVVAARPRNRSRRRGRRHRERPANRGRSR